MKNQPNLGVTVMSHWFDSNTILNSFYPYRNVGVYFYQFNKALKDKMHFIRREGVYLQNEND